MTYPVGENRNVPARGSDEGRAVTESYLNGETGNPRNQAQAHAHGERCNEARAFSPGSSNFLPGHARTSSFFSEESGGNDLT